MALRLFDVIGPFAMVGNRVDTQADYLAIALGELVAESGHVAEFGCADGRKVFRMGK
jgi:hypothetical protein